MCLTELLKKTGKVWISVIRLVSSWDSVYVWGGMSRVKCVLFGWDKCCGFGRRSSFPHWWCCVRITLKKQEYVFFSQSSDDLHLLHLAVEVRQPIRGYQPTDPSPTEPQNTTHVFSCRRSNHKLLENNLIPHTRASSSSCVYLSHSVFCSIFCLRFLLYFYVWGVFSYNRKCWSGSAAPRPLACDGGVIPREAACPPGSYSSDLSEQTEQPSVTEE